MLDQNSDADSYLETNQSIQDHQMDQNEDDINILRAEQELELPLEPSFRLEPELEFKKFKVKRSSAEGTYEGWCIKDTEIKHGFGQETAGKYSYIGKFIRNKPHGLGSRRYKNGAQFHGWFE